MQPGVLKLFLYIPISLKHRNSPDLVGHVTSGTILLCKIDCPFSISSMTGMLTTAEIGNWEHD